MSAGLDSSTCHGRSAGMRPGRAPVAGRAPYGRGPLGRPGRLTRGHADPLAALARYAHLAPAVATVALLAAPVTTGDVSTSGKITPADAASAVMVLTCAVRLLRERRRPLSVVAAVVLGAPALGFAVAAVVSPDPAAGVTGFLRYVQVFVLVPAAVVLLLRDRRDFAVLAGSVVALALVQGAVGVVQYATGTGASYAGQDVRAVGTFGPSDVMGMATVVAYGLLVAAAVALAPGGSRRLRLGALGCAAALAVPLVVSFSRGTWIATAAALAVMTLLAGPRQAVRVLAVAAAGAVVLVGGFGAGSHMIGERVASITQVTSAPDPSVTDRYALWDAAVSMWREHPVAGVGLKRFPDERDGHASLALSSGSDTAGAGQAFTREPLLSPHNMYLLVLGEQGLVGCVSVTGSWAALLVAGTARLVRGRRGPAAGRRCGLAAVGLLLWQCVDFLYADIGGPVTVLTAVLLGLAAWWSLAPSAAEATGGGSPGAGAGAGARAGAAAVVLRDTRRGVRTTGVVPSRMRHGVRTAGGAAPGADAVAAAPTAAAPAAVGPGGGRRHPGTAGGAATGTPMPAGGTSVAASGAPGLGAGPTSAASNGVEAAGHAPAARTAAAPPDHGTAPAPRPGATAAPRVPGTAAGPTHVRVTGVEAADHAPAARTAAAPPDHGTAPGTAPAPALGRGRDAASGPTAAPTSGRGRHGSAAGGTGGSGATGGGAR